MHKYTFSCQHPILDDGPCYRFATHLEKEILIRQPSNKCSHKTRPNMRTAPLPSHPPAHPLIPGVGRAGSNEIWNS